MTSRRPATESSLAAPAKTAEQKPARRTSPDGTRSSSRMSRSGSLAELSDEAGDDLDQVPNLDAREQRQRPSRKPAGPARDVQSPNEPVAAATNRASGGTRSAALSAAADDAATVANVPPIAPTDPEIPAGGD